MNTYEIRSPRRDGQHLMVESRLMADPPAPLRLIAPTDDWDVVYDWDWKAEGVHGISVATQKGS